MSLLDTFTILFQADTRSVEDGARRSENAADDLLNRLRDTDAAASVAGESFKGFVMGALGALTAALSVGQLVSSSIEKAADITALSQTADALGEAVEDVAAFGRAAAAAGGDAQGARDSLTDMAEKIGEALSDTESGAAQAFKTLGVGLTDAQGKSKGAIAGMLELAEAVEGMSRPEAVFKLKELGVTDNRMLEMMLKGRKEMERMIAVEKEQGVVSRQTAEQAKKITDGMNKLRGALDTASTGFMTALIPAIAKGVEWLTAIVDWAGEHSDFIVGFFMAIGAAVAVFYVPPMIAAAAATLAATWPIIAIGAAVAATAALFALAYDDILNFIEGNDSLIGQVFEKYPMAKDVVFALIDAFKVMGQVVSDIWKALVIGFQQVIDFVMTGVRQIANGVSTVASFFGVGADDQADDEPGSEGTPAGSDTAEHNPARPSGSGQSPEDVPRIPGTSNGIVNTRTALAGVEAGRAAMTAAGASPLNATTSNAISNTLSSNRETNVQVGEVIVNTQATDAKGVASDIGGELSAQLKQLDSEFSSGVDR